MQKIKPARKQPRAGNRWQLQDAKANLSELVRRAADNPQRITVRGMDAAVVVSAAEFQRLSREPTGQALLDIMAKCPHDFEIERTDYPALSREIEL